MYVAISSVTVMHNVMYVMMYTERYLQMYEVGLLGVLHAMMQYKQQVVQGRCSASKYARQDSSHVAICAIMH